MRKRSTPSYLCPHRWFASDFGVFDCQLGKRSLDFILGFILDLIISVRCFLRSVTILSLRKIPFPMGNHRESCDEASKHEKDRTGRIDLPLLLRGRLASGRPSSDRFLLFAMVSAGFVTWIICPKCERGKGKRNADECRTC